MRLTLQGRQAVIGFKCSAGLLQFVKIPVGRGDLKRFGMYLVDGDVQVQVRRIRVQGREALVLAQADGPHLAAARQGDFHALVGVLPPDVVLRSDGGTARARFTTVLRGVQQVTGPAVDAARRLAPFARPALVNGAAGVVTVAGGRVLSVMGFTVVAGKIVAIDVLLDPDRLAELDIAELGFGD